MQNFSKRCSLHIEFGALSKLKQQNLTFISEEAGLEPRGHGEGQWMSAGYQTVGGDALKLKIFHQLNPQQLSVSCTFGLSSVKPTHFPLRVNEDVLFDSTYCCPAALWQGT